MTNRKFSLWNEDAIRLTTVPAIEEVPSQSQIAPFDTHSIAISSFLRRFFQQSSNNHIEFLGCSSENNIPIQNEANWDSKSQHSPIPLPNRTSWKSTKKNECNLILYEWQMYLTGSSRVTHFTFGISSNKGFTTKSWAISMRPLMIRVGRRTR